MSGQRESNTLFKFRDIAQLQRKLTAISALTALRENRHFARIAQNYAVRVSEIVRKVFLVVSLSLAQHFAVRVLHAIAGSPRRGTTFPRSTGSPVCLAVVL